MEENEEKAWDLQNMYYTKERELRETADRYFEKGYEELPIIWDEK